MRTPLALRTHEEMKDVLMDPQADGPAIHYYMIRGGSEATNITIWDFGTVGREYIKAYGHYHREALGETYTIMSGEGILLMQKRKIDAVGMPIDDELESCQAIYVKAPQEIFIPPGFGHLLVNTGTTWLVTADDSPVNFEEHDASSKPSHADYEPMKKLHGFAYYVVQENGIPTFVKNQNYTSPPALVIKK